jgi:hypothetical protein
MPDLATDQSDIHAIDIIDKADIVGRTGIEDIVAISLFNSIHIAQSELHTTPEFVCRDDFRSVKTVRTAEYFQSVAYAFVVGKESYASSAVAAHGGLETVRIEIAHIEFGHCVSHFEQHEPIGADSEMSVAQSGNKFGCGVERKVATVD